MRGMILEDGDLVNVGIMYHIRGPPLHDYLGLGLVPLRITRLVAMNLGCIITHPPKMYSHFIEGFVIVEEKTVELGSHLSSFLYAKDPSVSL